MTLVAAILAGGMGTRLRSILPDTPKALASINGVPFVTKLLNQLTSAGFEDAVLCTGYLADQFPDCLGDRYGKMLLAYSVEQRPLGTAGALRQAVPLLRGDVVLAMNGDSYVNVPLQPFIQWHSAQPDAGGILLVRVENAARFGTVEIDSHGKILSFREKQGLPVPGWINAGIYLLPKAWISELPEGTNLSLEQTVLPGWLERGFRAYKANGAFIDIGTPETLEQAATFAYV